MILSKGTPAERAEIITKFVSVAKVSIVFVCFVNLYELRSVHSSILLRIFDGGAFEKYTSQRFSF